MTVRERVAAPLRARREALGGLAVAGPLVAAIALGSRGFRDFDPALTHYALAAVLAAFAVGYRTASWLARPPTRLYAVRGWRLFRARNAASFAASAARGLGAQTFVFRRSRLRWLTHLCLSWGTIAAFAITLPLVFGWVHFETPLDDAETYRTIVFGFAVGEFSVHSWRAAIAFHALNVSAVAVVAGVLLAFVRRLRDRGERALQGFERDLVPLLLLFAVAASGLALTGSARALAGRGYAVAGWTHAATVIALLFYLPFGKLFHVFQRPAQLAVAEYRRSGSAGEQAHCARCGDAFASAMHIADLRSVVAALGRAPLFARGGERPPEVCPACRRRLVALAQGRILGR